MSDELNNETTAEPVNPVDATLIASICHEANRALCERFGDNSQKSWAEAHPEQRESAIKGVEYRLANPEATPEDQHEAWSKEKEANGWVFGPVKDFEAKTHPCLVPYDELPLNQRLKDHLFQGIVDALATASGLYGENDGKAPEKKAANKKEAAKGDKKPDGKK